MIALLLNSVLSLLNASWAMQNAQQYQSDDSLLICTGKSVKWISQSAFVDFGVVVELPPPSAAPDNLHQIDCGADTLSDQKTPLNSATDQVDATFTQASLILSLDLASPLGRRFTLPQNRAPPILS